MWPLASDPEETQDKWDRADHAHRHGRDALPAVPPARGTRDFQPWRLRPWKRGSV